ncbi:hypothetical protein D3C71_1273220 [compost metagenome]
MAFQSLCHNWHRHKVQVKFPNLKPQKVIIFDNPLNHCHHHYQLQCNDHLTHNAHCYSVSLYQDATWVRTAMRLVHMDLNSTGYYFHYGVNHLSRQMYLHDYNCYSLYDLRPSGLKPRLQPRLYLVKALYPSNGNLRHNNPDQNQSRHLHGEHWLAAPLESTDIVRLVGCPNRACYIALADHSAA